jgi:hypothetical protein
MPIENRITLRNPDSAKTGAPIARAKYGRMRAAILAVLGRDGSLTYT